MSADRRPMAGMRLASVALVLLCSVALALETRPFFPFHVGDQRALRGEEGTARELFTGRSDIGGVMAWRSEMWAPGAATPDVAFWAQDAEGTKLVGLRYAGQTIRLQPPILFPAEVNEGQRVPVKGQLVHSLLGPIGTYDGYMEVEDTDASADTPAGQFSNCLQVFYDFYLRVAGQEPQEIIGRERRAAGVGVVWLQDEANENEKPYVLVYAKVGDQYFGQAADVNGDGQVDLNDALALIEGYLGGKDAYDVALDLAPYSGEPPRIVPEPDGKVDEADVAAFMAVYAALVGR